MSLETETIREHLAVRLQSATLEELQRELALWESHVFHANATALIGAEPVEYFLAEIRKEVEVRGNLGRGAA
jgi:hypothetical protein